MIDEPTGDHPAAEPDRPAIMDAGFPDIHWSHPARVIVTRPIAALIVGLLPVVLFALGLARLERDPSVDAFVSHDHPAWQTREMARDLFGLEDPVIVVFAQEPGVSAFNQATLAAVDAFTDEVTAIAGVEEGVVSIGSEKAILADLDGNLETPEIIDPDAIDPDRSRALAQLMPQLSGTLVADVQDAFAVVVPVTDPNRAERQVAEIAALAERLAPTDVSVHLAGVATMNSALAGHIARDTVIFLPAAFVTIAFFLLLALKRVRAIIGPFVVVIGAAISAVGAIGVLGSKYYLITTALPVVVMAIAVADSIHLTLAYQKRRGDHPDEGRRRSMAEAIEKVGLPIILTSVTTALGFAGLALGSPMKPIADFGLVAAIGTMVACLLSLTVLPLIQLRLADLPLAISRAPRLDRVLGGVAQWSADRPLPALGVSALVVGAALAGAALVTFDYERRNYFSAGDPVLLADQILAERFSGGNILDVVIDAAADEALLVAPTVRQIDALQRDLEAIPQIAKVTSFVDSIALMHERLNAAPPGSLPVQRDAPAQYMFLYDASGDPDDFDAQLDFGRRYAMMRGYLENGQYGAAVPVIDRVEEIVAKWSQETGVTASVSGRMAVNDGWMGSLRDSHATTIGAAVVFVMIATWIFLRGLRPAITAVLPVLTGITLLYAAMGITGIDLAPATSMCAAIAAGLGVDFGIHLVEELRHRMAAGRGRIESLGGNYVVVMRACFFSAASLGAGFLVVALSQTPVLRWFGLLIAFAAFGSLFGALVIVPAIAALTSRNWGKKIA